MITTAGGVLIALTLAGGALPADTTILVPAGARLDVEAAGGSITVDTWDRNEVRIQATHGSRDQIRVETTGTVVRVRSERAGLGAQGIIDYRITLPPQMDLELSGMYTTIAIRGSRGQVRATTVQGDISLTGGTGKVSLTTVQGRVEVQGARGDVQVQSIAGSVRLRDAEGAVDAQTVSGAMVLDDVRSTNVNASSVSGHIYFNGNIVPGGRYTFTTHAGPITLGVPENLNATVTLARMTGSFSSTLGALSFSGDGRGRRESVVVGNGSAMLELETFAGRIRVMRRAEATPP